MRKMFFFICLLISWALNASELKRPSVQYEDLLKIAKHSISVELTTFNGYLSSNLQIPKKFRKSVKLFKKLEISEIDEDYLFDKCIYNGKDILNLLSPVLTNDDDETYGKKNQIADLRSIYGKRFYLTIYNLCEAARVRFGQRLKTIQFEQSDYQLPTKDQQQMSSIIFLPTIEGKRTFLDKISERDVVLGGVVVAGAAGAALGLALPSLFISVIYLVDEAGVLVSNIQGINPAIYQRRIELLGPNDQTEALSVDLLKEEQQY